MYSGDAGQKHNAETLWNYAFMEMLVDEIGIIVSVFYFMPWMNVQAKWKKTYLVLSLFFLSVLSSFLSSQYSLSFSFLSPKWSVFFLFFLWLRYLLPFFSPYFNWFILFKNVSSSVLERLREVTTLWLIHICYFFIFNFFKN